MARKGVNLLEGDDEEREGDSDGDSGDDGGSYERRRGGFVDVLMVILFVCVMLGGVAWAGYQFWWLPKMKKTEQLETARIKQEQQRRMRLAKVRGATERAQQTPGASGQFRQNQSRQEQKRGLRGAEQNMQPARPAPSKSAAEPISPAASMMNQKAASRSPAEKAPLAAAPIMEKPAIPSRAKTRPKQQMVMAAEIPEKKAPAKTTAPVRPNPRRKLAAEKKTEKAKAKIRGETSIRKPSQGYYYSVQVASCRTGRCAETFSKRLKGKGFSVFKVAGTSRARRSSRRMTEVRLGSFSSLAEARALASEARKKKIGARVYRYNNRWRVAAGSFRNLEDAALLLDRAEDSGFRGELASRLQSGGTRRLYRIRTGKFESLRDALAFRKKIRLAGFSDAIVVRRRSRK